MNQEYFNSPRGRLVIAAVGVILAALLVSGLLAYRQYNRDIPAAPINYGASPTPSVTPTASTLPTDEPTVSVFPSSSPGVTSSPTASPLASLSPSPTAVIVLPGALKDSVGAFYKANAAKDRGTLAHLFTADTTDELRSLHSRLFTGLDTDGSPGGPTLFSSNSASESVASYTVTTASQQGGGWAVTTKEQRLNGSGKPAEQVEAVLVFLPASPWSIDAYHRVGSSGKYDAFLIQ